MFYQTKKFKALSCVWKKRLRSSGFVDIEESGRHATVAQDLNQRIYFRSGINQLTPLYYDWAQARLKHGKFKNPRHRRVWRAYAAGETIPHIAKREGVGRRWMARLVASIEIYLKEKR